MKSLVNLIIVVIWIAGVVIAKGFWSTLAAVLIPFWAYYLVIEELLILQGII